MPEILLADCKVVFPPLRSVLYYVAYIKTVQHPLDETTTSHTFESFYNFHHSGQGILIFELPIIEKNRVFFYYPKQAKIGSLI